MVCPVSLHLGLSPARQVGRCEACTRLCLEFFLLTLSQGFEKSITLKKKKCFLNEEQPWLLPRSEVLFQLLEFVFAGALEKL